LFKNVNPSSTNGSYPRALTVAGSNLFFIADDGTHGEQLWVTDGTDAGTISLQQPSQPTDALKNSELAAVGAQVFFAAVDSAKGRQLWASDGTLAGTVLTDAVNPAGDSNRLRRHRHDAVLRSHRPERRPGALEQGRTGGGPAGRGHQPDRQLEPRHPRHRRDGPLFRGR
jgi:ELWxxDGT repeat protein